MTTCKDYNQKYNECDQNPVPWLHRHTVFSLLKIQKTGIATHDFKWTCIAFL